MDLRNWGQKLISPTKKISSDNSFGLDLLRICAAFMVYLFHININLKFRTGVLLLDQILSVGAVFMGCFFMLSGFVFSYRYGQTDLLASPEKLKSFYKKRLLRIYPAYLLFLLIVFLFRLSFPTDPKVLTTLIPIDLLGLQAFFRRGGHGWATAEHGSSQYCWFSICCIPFCRSW